MKQFLKKIRFLVLSLLLLYPAQIAAQLFVYFFASITGLLIPGYAIGCILFGFLASLPILRRISRSEKSRSLQIILHLLTVLLMSGVLFLSMVSLNIS